MGWSQRVETFKLDEYNVEIYKTHGGQYWWQLTQTVQGQSTVMKVGERFCSSHGEARSVAWNAYHCLPMVVA